MTLFLAVVLLADVAMSIRPMAFIRACLSGVNLPENFWWVLLVIKTLAAAGLIADHWLADAGYAGVGLAATVGVGGVLPVCRRGTHSGAFPGQGILAKLPGNVGTLSGHAGFCRAMTSRTVTSR